MGKGSNFQVIKGKILVGLFPFWERVFDEERGNSPRIRLE